MCSEKHNSCQTTLNADVRVHLHSSHAHVEAVKISKIRKKKPPKQNKKNQGRKMFLGFFLYYMLI